MMMMADRPNVKYKKKKADPVKKISGKELAKLIIK